MADSEKSTPPPLTVKGLQETVYVWIKTYGVRYFSEMTNLAVLMEEVGELARIMSRTYSEQSFKGWKNTRTLVMNWPTLCLSWSASPTRPVWT